MFIRLHTKPKICRDTDSSTWTSKQDYYFNRSYGRYLLTDEGIRVSLMAYHAARATEIGRYEECRIIYS